MVCVCDLKFGSNDNRQADFLSAYNHLHNRNIDRLLLFDIIRPFFFFAFVKLYFSQLMIGEFRNSDNMVCSEVYDKSFFWTGDREIVTRKFNWSVENCFPYQHSLILLSMCLFTTVYMYFFTCNFSHCHTSTYGQRPNTVSVTGTALLNSYLCQLLLKYLLQGQPQPQVTVYSLLPQQTG